MKRPVPVESASAQIDKKIKELGDWRGGCVRNHTRGRPQWMGSPLWRTFQVYSIPASTAISARAIDIHESDKVDEAALKDLIRAAVALNLSNSNPGERAASDSLEVQSPVALVRICF